MRQLYAHTHYVIRKIPGSKKNIRRGASEYSLSLDTNKLLCYVYRQNKWCSLVELVQNSSSHKIIRQR